MADWFDENPYPGGASGQFLSGDQYPGGGGLPHQDPTTGAWVDNSGQPTNTGINGPNGGLRVGVPGQPSPNIQVGGGSPSGGAAPSVNRQDPQSVAAYVAYYAQQPGANPSLARDPNYWIQKITSGELGDDPGYYVSKFMTPEGAPAGQGGGNPSGINGPFGATPFNFTFSEDDPSYQFLKKEVLGATQNSQFARGTGLTGGAAKELQDRAGGLASTEYGNAFQRAYQTNALNFNQGLAANQNYFGQNFSLTGLGLDATRNAINGSNGLASNATSYDNNAQNRTNAITGLYGNQGNVNAAGTIGNQNNRNQFYDDLGNLARRY